MIIVPVLIDVFAAVLECLKKTDSQRSISRGILCRAMLSLTVRLVAGFSVDHCHAVTGLLMSQSNHSRG